MFRRKPLALAVDDPLITGDLPTRVQTARTRLTHQDDPVLLAAKSVAELAADRAVAERVRKHHRAEQIAKITAAEITAAQVRKASAKIVEADVQDLMFARRALADRRRQDSPHASLASLFKIKRWSGRALAGVVVAAMLYSAINVQHNLAPGGPADPLYWASYLLEALISTVLVVFMVAGSAVAQWRITDGQELIRWTEGMLLTTSIGLNTYPYIGRSDWFGVATHGVAPVMIGVALVAHDAVSQRLGQAIAAAAATVPTGDDIAERLAALTQTAAPAPQTPTAADSLACSSAGVVGFERELDRRSRTGIVPLASGSEEDCAREEPPAEPATVARVDAAADREQSIVAREPSPTELGIDPGSLAEPTAGTAPADEMIPRAPEKDRRAVVSLVGVRQGRRGSASRALRTGCSPVERASAVDGALARRSDQPRARTNNLFAREMSRDEATSLARAVLDSGKSKQPADLLAKIYLAHSQGKVPNAISTTVGLPHSTVDRAIAAAVHIAAGTRPA
jgi:hypothetical protein